MRYSPLLTASLLLVACADSPSTPAAGSTTDAPGSTAAPEESGTSTSPEDGSSSGTTRGEVADGSSSTGTEPLEPIALDRAWVDRIAGPWLGPVTGTPMGDIPQFFLDFAWNDGEELVAVADNGRGFRLEFTFSERDGQWIFTELGELPGGLVQTYDLHPVEREGDRVRFEVLEQPGYLSVEIEATDGEFEMAVQVRGNGHGTFSMARPS